MHQAKCTLVMGFHNKMWKLSISEEIREHVRCRLWYLPDLNNCYTHKYWIEYSLLLNTVYNSTTWWYRLIPGRPVSVVRGISGGCVIIFCHTGGSHTIYNFLGQILVTFLFVFPVFLVQSPYNVGVQLSRFMMFGSILMTNQSTN